MTFKLTTISVVLFITTLLNFFNTFVSWQRRKTKGGVYVACGMTAITLWTLAAGFGYAASPIPVKVFFAKLEYVGHHTALAFFAAFALSYAGFGDWLEKIWIKGIFVVIPLLNILLAWTNDQHGWLWSGFTRNELRDNVVVFEHGPGFVWVTLTGYVFVFILVLSLWHASQKGSLLLKRQARVLLSAVFCVIISNLVYLLKIPALSGIDWSSIAFSLSGFIFLLALYGTRFLDVVPIARYTIIEKMSDIVLVLDANNHLVDSNQMAHTTFGIDRAQLGNPFDSVMANWPQIIDLVSQNIETEAQIEVVWEGTPRIFDTRLTGLKDHSGFEFGKLIVFRDISKLYQAEEALYASEERYRTVADYTYDWEYWRTPDGAIQYMSPSCERVTGYHADEFITDPNLLEEIVLPEDRRLLDQHKMAIPPAEKANFLHRVDFRIRRRDGEIRWIAHTCQTIYKADGANLGLRATNRDITDTKLAEEKLQQILNRLVEEQHFVAASEERQRLARDLHDSVNQSIHSLVLLSETLRVVLERGQVQRATHIAERLEESARQSLKDVRLMLYQLQPSDVLKEGKNLFDALEHRLNTVERRAGVQAELIREGNLDECPLEWYLHIFYIAIEALNNAIKHAQATRVQVLLCCNSQNTILEINDNGIGFEPAMVHTGGMGLGNMRERGRLLGGELTITSSPQKGTRVRLTIARTADAPTQTSASQDLER